MPKNIRSRIAAGTGNLTVAKSIIPLTENLALEANSERVPDWAFYDKLEAEISAIAGGATQVIWNLAKDAAGDFAITPEVTTTFVVGATTATLAGLAALVQSDRAKNTLQVSGTVYLVARTDAGTLVLDRALLYFVP
jgi:hypothetical protein